MDIFKSIILGIIQGLTEFLPVSSSGHIELGKALLGTSDVGIDFSILVHIATALSTVIVFRKIIGELIINILKFDKESLNYVGMLLVSAIPVAVIGLGFKDQIEVLFDGYLPLVGAMLLVTAFLLFLTTKVKSSDKSITYGTALIIGVAQMLAIMPGISRSGSTIATALLLNIDKEKAARFSFLMVLIPIFGQALLDGIDMAKGEVAWDLDPTVALAGFIAAFLSGLFACTAMLKIVKKGKLYYFSIYCVIVGIIAIVSGFF